jgi:hypothetical protein
MKRLSSEESEKIAELYMEMVSADILGDIGGDEADLGTPNKDDYAKGDNRIPKLIGNVQTRKGSIKNKQKKSK